jgi:prophage regulatory protein
MSRVLLRLPEVTARTGLTESQVYTRQDAGTFPQSVSIGLRTVAWVEDEIDTWIEERIARRDQQSPEEMRAARQRIAGPGRGRKGHVNVTDRTL